MVKRKIICVLLVAVLMLSAGCGKEITEETKTTAATEVITEATTEATTESTTEATTTTSAKTDAISAVSIYPSKTVKYINNSFSYASYTGDYGLDTFLREGGAKNNDDLLVFFTQCIALGKVKLDFTLPGIGCSTIAVPSSEGGYYFGRNFDWNYCDTMIMVTKPSKGYKSISTVNTSFLKVDGIELTEDMIRFCAIYSPLDGMNEKGLCISVNMVNDGNATIEQNTNKTDLTTSTAVRLLLDRAATVDEAVNLLKGYDMHASYGYMIHFAISDKSGKSVAVEYINNKLYVTETKVLTNFYVTEGSKYGIGSKESVTRYDMLNALIEETPAMSKEQVRDALSTVSKNSNEFKTTVWSVIYDQKNMTATYFWNGNFKKAYVVAL